MKTVETAIVAALEKILTPLVRILIRFNVSHSEFSEVVRRVYVKVSTVDLTVDGVPPTVSRVAVVTGLSRKEVVRLTNEDLAEEKRPSNKPNRALRVITAWLTSPEFLDKKGNPKELPMRGSRGSFLSLVRQYSGDIKGRAVLEELLRLKAVEQTDDKQFRLVRQAFVPVEDEADKIDVMGTCVKDMLSTIGHNIASSARDALLQQQVVYHNIPAEVVTQFRALSREKCEKVIGELNQWLSARKKETANTTGHRIDRVGLGLYYIQTPA
jgi:hypothetical protein